MASETDKTAVKLAMDELFEGVESKDIGAHDAVIAGRRDWEQSHVFLMRLEREGKSLVVELDTPFPFDPKVRDDLKQAVEDEKKKLADAKAAIVDADGVKRR